jgi:hypothetical protein
MEMAITVDALKRSLFGVHNESNTLERCKLPDDRRLSTALSAPRLCQFGACVCCYTRNIVP